MTVHGCLEYDTYLTTTAHTHKEKLNKSLLVSLFFSLLRKYKIATLEKFDVAAIFRKTV